MSSEEEFTPGS